MAQTFIYENFNITLSLNANSVYMRVINKVTFQTYESNIDERTLKIPFPIEETYKLIIETLNKTTNFNVNFIVHKDILELDFQILLHNILNLNFKILLKEKIISGNEEATMLLNNIEENFNNEIIGLKDEIKNLKEENNKLMKVIDNISFAEIALLNYTSHHGSYIIIDISFPINSDEINIEFDIKTYQQMRFSKIYFNKLKYFFNLKKLIFEQLNFNDFDQLSNNSLEELYIKISSSVGNNGSLTSLNGIQNFPNLKILHIERCVGLKDVYNTLSNIKHNIKQMTFIGCTAIDQQNLKLYCEQNKIHLQIA